MSVYVGNTYKFVLQSNFSELDGIYKVLRIMTYDETVSDQIDLMELYVKHSKTAEDFENDLPVIRDTKVLKLQSVLDLSVVHIPTNILQLEPDPSVQKYLHLSLGIDLGIFSTLDQVLYIKEVVHELINGGLGVDTEPVIIEISSRQKWMTTEEYDTLDSERRSKKERVINYYTENNRLRKELLSERAKVAAYEQILKQLRTE